VVDDDGEDDRGERWMFPSRPELAGDRGWEIPASARAFQADMARAELGNFAMTDLDPRGGCCNAVVALFVNALKFQLKRLAVVVDLARTEKQFLTLDRANAMYDWIEELQSKRFVPLLNCLRDDVLPELGRAAAVPEASPLYVESRAATFEAVQSALRTIVATSNALTPRLPAGERVYVLVYKCVQFEAQLLALLEEVVRCAVPRRTPTRAVQRELVALERYMFEILVYTAGTVPAEGGGVLYDEQGAQNMRGVMTAWMAKEEVAEMRSRMGIRFFNRRRARALREARSDYLSHSKEGRFVAEFERAIAADIKRNKPAAKGVDVDADELTKQLNRMQSMRRQEEENGRSFDGLDADDAPNGAVSGLREVTLVFRNVYEDSPGTTPATTPGSEVSRDSPAFDGAEDGPQGQRQ
jgi:hypothetical protein